jgi:hypothetical protein
MTDARRGTLPHPGPRSRTPASPAALDAPALGSAWWRRVPLAGLAATLALLPFEGLLLRSVTLPAGRFTITDVEAVATLTIAVWTLSLAVRRRAPAVPRPLGLALAALVLVTSAAAVTAGPFAAVGAQVTARAALGWGLLLVTIDLVRGVRVATVLVLVLSSTMLVSAGVGWVAWWNGSAYGLFGAGRLFAVGGVARMAGTWDYPTIAAMAWEAGLLLALPLLARPMPPLARAGLAAACLALGGAVLLTLTRGAFLGLGAGLAILLLVGLARRWRALTALAAGTAVAIALGAVALYAALPLPLTRLLEDGDRGLYGAAYDVPGRVVAPPGATLSLTVRVTNTGSATWDPDDAHPWLLGVVWLAQDTLHRAPDHHVAGRLPGPVPPGASVGLRATARVPTAPGAWALAWDMEHAGVAAFSERAVPVAVTAVDVDAGATAAAPLSGGPPATRQLYPELLPAPSRADLWRAAIGLALDHPLLGVGPGAFRLAYGPELGLARWDTEVHSNDLYLELAATTGLLGLAAFAALVAIAVRDPARAALGRGSTALPLRTTGLVAGSLAATGAALAHGVVDHFLVFAGMGILFWVLLGIGVGLVDAVGSSRAARGGPR